MLLAKVTPVGAGTGANVTRLLGGAGVTCTLKRESAGETGTGVGNAVGAGIRSTLKGVSGNVGISSVGDAAVSVGGVSLLVLATDVRMLVN